MQANTLFMTDNQKVMWAEAGTTFPGEQLDKVIQRALMDLSPDRLRNDYYEIRRFDAPNAFDSLLKLQNTGAARRHIEVDQDEFREVLRVEAMLFVLIMQAIAMLLDIFLRVLGGALKGASINATIPLTVARTPQKYVPTWQRQPRIEHDDSGYTS
ncbi:hypothetical protein WHX55_09850 [Pseudomonas fluorescens]|uniref:hypothetical protein n=1 Tax=Pseudomonas fluorescens TaxID=294 RepID=UPI00325104CA